MNSRWQANKIGLINFWYYDEQEFPFVKGRILLRGSNGSGKSVTMQSVVPLLLDGNMSPERLDPFGLALESVSIAGRLRPKPPPAQGGAATQSLHWGYVEGVAPSRRLRQERRSGGDFPLTQKKSTE